MNHNDNFVCNDSVSRPGAGNNLPGALADKPGWDHPVMKFAKLVCWQFALQRAGSEGRLVLNKDWGALGISGKSLLAEVRRLTGNEFDRAWAEQGRVEDESRKAADLHNRLYHQYTEYDGEAQARVRRISREHPLRSLHLLESVPAAIALYVAGKEVSKEVMEASFG